MVKQVVALLAMAAPALALPTMVASTLTLPTLFMDTLQAIFGTTSLDLPKPEIGWADPRINGGQFVDVSLSCTNSIKILVKFSCSSQLPDMGNH
jgi:hypothetical protein